MLHLNKLLKNQRGLTLVELLASVVLISIISIFIFSITTKAIENNLVITQETMLRDEADIIVSKFIKSLYASKQGYIVQNVPSANESYLEITNDLEKCKKDDSGNWIFDAANQCRATLKPIGFKTTDGETKAYFVNSSHIQEEYSVQQKNIKLLSTSKIIGNPADTNVYEIILDLKITHKRGNKEITKTMSFKNEVQPILTSK